MSSRSVSRWLGTGTSGGGDGTMYRSMMESGGRPQMGFAVVFTDASMNGFLYHSLDNLRFEQRHGRDFLAFTHRGTAVTMQGLKLDMIFRAIMRHLLVEIVEWDHVKKPESEDQPVIEKILISYPFDQNPAEIVKADASA